MELTKPESLRLTLGQEFENPQVIQMCSQGYHTIIPKLKQTDPCASKKYIK